MKEKEKEFHMIERMGMLAMLQKYFENKMTSRFKSIEHFHGNFVALKAYFNNVESFNSITSSNSNNSESAICL